MSPTLPCLNKQVAKEWRLKEEKESRSIPAAEVTNPDPNESQQMFALCDRVKEIVTNRQGKKEKRLNERK